MKAIVRTAVVLGLVSLLPRGGPGGGQALAAADKSTDSGGAARASRPVTAPAFAEKDIFGKRTVALRNYRGKVVLLNFWATWCGPCRQEIPALKAIQATHEGQVEVIGIAVYSSDQDTERFHKSLDITYPVIYGSFDLMEKYDRVASIPTTFVVDRKGAIVARVVGSRTREQYEKMLEPLLNE
jgi:thiol-disulfide isomerase/thioredoxin